MKILDRLWAKWQAESPGGDESGQNLVLVALFMVAILGIAAMVLDGGYAFAQRRRMQNAADAGTLAGARELALGRADSAIYAAIDEYTRLENGAGSFEATYYPGGEPVGAGSIPDAATGVTVTASVISPTFFAGVLGVDELTASASAVASYSAISSLQGSPVWPVAVYRQGFVLDQLVTLWDNAQEGSGSFGWVDFNGGSNPTPEQAEWLGPGFVPSGDTPTLLYQTGEIYSPYVQAPRLDLFQFGPQSHFWIQGAPGVRSSLESVAAQHIGQTVTVLLYDDTNLQGSSFRFRIIGFAQFRVSSVDFKTTPKSVAGRFVRQVKFGEGSASQDFGLRTVNLTD